MITNIRNVKIYSRDEITNEQYHEETDHISGSSLTQILNDCPAAWKYGEKEETKALLFGTAGHASILEPDLFAADYYRIPDAVDYEGNENLLATDTAVKAYLKSVGYKGYSTLKGNALYAAVSDCDPNMICLRDLQSIEADKNPGKTGLSAKDFDNLFKMKSAVIANGYDKYINGADVEVSIFCEIEIDSSWYAVKIKPDVLSSGVVIDYKTTNSAHPEEFGKQAHRMGYWLKMALQHDVLLAMAYSGFIEYFGNYPLLLAQSKRSPFIPQMYQLTEEQIDIGRGEYITALKTYKHCEENGYYAYGGGIKELSTPAWVK